MPPDEFYSLLSALLGFEEPLNFFQFQQARLCFLESPHAWSLQGFYGYRTLPEIYQSCSIH